MPIELVTRGAKKAYEERKLGVEGSSLFNLVGRTEDTDTSGSVLVDRYISSPFAVTYRNKNNESKVRNFQPGSGQLVDVPRISEKTPIDEELRDQVAVGVEPSTGAMTSIMKNIDQIMGDHIEGHLMTKNKQAIDFLRTGIFNAPGTGGADLGLSIDFGRDAGNDINYDFTGATASFLTAIREAQDQLRSQGCPLNGMVMILGDSWATEFSQDTDIQALRRNNGQNVIVEAQMEAPQLLGVEGLQIVTRLRDSAMLAPVWICRYEPPTQYISAKGATPAPFLPDTEAVMFSLGSKTWRVYRGVDAFDANGKATRAVGEMVVDSYDENDPITTYVRSQSRHLILPGNIDHTLRSTGTFA